MLAIEKTFRNVIQCWTHSSISFTKVAPKQPNGLAGEGHGSVILFPLFVFRQN
jgi:hypothetical protein